MMKSLQTQQLGAMIMRQMHAPDSVEEEYTRHLALFVRYQYIYVRDLKMQHMSYYFIHLLAEEVCKRSEYRS